MKLFLSSIGAILSPFKVLLMVLLEWLMPMRGKRILFITSVYMHLTKRKEPQPEFLRKLNEAMRLAEDSDALILPAQLYQLFWNESIDKALEDVNLSDMLTSGDPERQRMFCNLLVRTTPRWMRYGHYEDMVKDTMKTVDRARFEQPSTLLQAA